MPKKKKKKKAAKAEKKKKKAKKKELSIVPKFDKPTCFAVKVTFLCFPFEVDGEDHFDTGMTTKYDVENRVRAMLEDRNHIHDIEHCETEITVKADNDENWDEPWR